MERCARSDHACIQSIRNSFEYYFTDDLPYLSGSLIRASRCDTGHYISSKVDPTDPNSKTLFETPNEAEATRFDIQLNKHKEVGAEKSNLYVPMTATEFNTGFKASNSNTLVNLATPGDGHLASFEIEHAGIKMDTFQATMNGVCLVFTPTTWGAVPYKNREESDNCMDLLGDPVTEDDMLMESYKECCGTFFTYRKLIVPCA